MQLTATDENSKTVTSTYNDSYFWRPASAVDQLSTPNTTNFTYAGPTSVEAKMNFNGSASTSDVLATTDSLGRLHVSQVKQGPSASNYDSVETDYDNVGRPVVTTIPYSATANSTCTLGPPCPGSGATYDALGRPKMVSDAGGGSVTYTYNQNDVKVSAGPAPSGENTKDKQLEYDALGRLTSVCEITSGTTAWPSASCGQTNSASGYLTTYTYDLSNNLTGVTQNAQATSNHQTRSYAYDILGRMLSETNPETGTINYVYDSDSTCGTSSGDLVKKTDAIGNVTCYAYDALHRVTSVTFPSGPDTSRTPNKYFVYDSATVNSVTMTNAKGRLAEAYTCTSCPGTKITDVGLSYTARGETSDRYELTPHSTNYFHVAETYWANGAVNTISGLAGVPTITYGVDGEGRTTTASASSGTNPLTGTTYSPYASPPTTQVTFGSGDSDTFTYDSNTGRMTQYKFNVNGSSLVGNLTWNALGTLASLGITDPFNSSDAQTCNFAHDDLVRIASDNCGSVWSQTFSYDPFGNINKSGNNSFSATYSASTNQMTSIGSSTPSYETNGSATNGNVTNDFLHTYAWDSNGRPTTIDSVGATYDALGNMVEQNRSGAYTQIVYAPDGTKLGLMSGTSTLQKAFVPLTGGATAVYTSSPSMTPSYYRHSDWLGSSRFASTPSRTMYSDTAYAPFGEAYAGSGTADPSFTGMDQDTSSNVYDFPAREYGIQGRWPSPDPLGVGAANPSDPQTWNRYSYVRNSPLSLIDPTGMDACIDRNNNVLDGYEEEDCAERVASCLGELVPVCAKWVYGDLGDNCRYDFNAPTGMDCTPDCPASQQTCGTPPGPGPAPSDPGGGGGAPIMRAATPAEQLDYKIHCAGQGAVAGVKDFLGGLIFKDEIDAVANSIADGSLAPLESLVSVSVATDLAQRGAKYVAATRSAQKTIKAYTGISANAAGRFAKLLGKAAALVGIGLSATTGYNAYSECLHPQ